MGRGTSAYFGPVVRFFRSVPRLSRVRARSFWPYSRQVRLRIASELPSNALPGVQVTSVPMPDHWIGRRCDEHHSVVNSRRRGFRSSLENTRTGRSRPTLAGVIWSNGLWHQPS